MYTEQELENELKKSTFIGAMENELFCAQYEDGEGENFETLFEICFNSDYPIIGYYWANEALKKYKGATLDGVFGAIHDCEAYLNSEGLLESDDRQEWEDNSETLLARLEYCAGEYYLKAALSEANLSVYDLVVENAGKFEKALESIGTDHKVDFAHYVHDYLD